MAKSKGAQDFINFILPYARTASKTSGVPVSVIIAQVGNETGWGTSSAWTQSYNPAGIGMTGAPGAGMRYKSPEQGMADYAQKLMGHGEAGQEGVMRAVASGANAFDIALALEQSPWAAGHYGGHGLENIMATYNLTQYDMSGGSKKPRGAT